MNLFIADWDGDLRFEIPISWIECDELSDNINKRRRRRRGRGGRGRGEEEETELRSISRRFQLRNNNSKRVCLRLLAPSPFSTGDKRPLWVESGN